MAAVTVCLTAGTSLQTRAMGKPAKASTGPAYHHWFSRLCFTSRTLRVEGSVTTAAARDRSIRGQRGLKFVCCPLCASRFAWLPRCGLPLFLICHIG